MTRAVGSRKQNIGKDFLQEMVVSKQTALRPSNVERRKRPTFEFAMIMV